MSTTRPGEQGSTPELGGELQTQVGRQDGPPAHLLAALSPIPGYELREPVGRGGMGVVYRARDAALNRDVAVKILQEQFADAALVVGQFEKEAQITGQLQHPGVPPVHLVGRLPDDRPYLVMKLIRGRTLDKLLDDTSDPTSDRGRLVAVFEQVCQVVAYAHDRRVIHRDLKPSNVMVGAFGEVQVMDWGLAKVIQASLAEAVTEIQPTGPPDGSADTVAGAGTPAYMPPEQRLGRPVDRRADVFALGAILCRMLTGQPPYRGVRPEHALAAAHADGWLGEAFEGLDGCGADGELVALCKRCLAKEPGDRPNDAGELVEQLATYRAGVEDRLRKAETERATAEARAAAEEERRRAADERTVEQRRRFRLRLALAMAAMVILVGVGGVAWWRHEKAAQTRAGVTSALEQAVVLRKQYRFSEAENLLKTAGELAASNARDMIPPVEQARADLALVVKLDDIRMKRSTWITEPDGKGRFDTTGAVRDYPEVFRSVGLDILGANPDAVGAAVAASSVQAELIAALDDWAALRLDEPVRDRILEVLRRADPGPWLDAFRSPAVRRSPMALGLLARSADPASLSPATLMALSEVMEARGLDPVQLLQRAQFAHPSDFLTPFYLGLSASDPAEKVAHYRAARVTRPVNLAVLTNLGAALKDKGDVVGAIACYREAIRHDPKFALAQYNLGIVLTDKGDVEGAIACYKEVIRHQPTLAKTHYNLAVLLDGKGDVDGAIACYEEAIKHDPNFPQAHYNLGATLKGKGNVDGAIACYREAIRHQPTLAQAHNNLGNALKEKGKVDEAIACYKEAIRHQPTLAQAHHNLGNTLFGKGDVDEAITCYKEAVKHDPNFAQAHYNLGVALGAKGNVDGAMACYKEAISHDPKHAQAHTNLGAVYLGQKKYPEAIACARAATRADPNLSNAHAMLGHLLQLTGDNPGARGALTEAARLDPRWKPLLAKLPPVPVAPPPREKLGTPQP
jgi:tetratricopeptide (TPR) repeat protein